MADISGVRVQGKPRLGWMDGVKVASGSIEMMIHAGDPPCIPRLSLSAFSICSQGESLV